MYTWPDATLRELTDLVKEVQPAARRSTARLEFALVYPDKRGRNVMRVVRHDVTARACFYAQHHALLAVRHQEMLGRDLKMLLLIRWARRIPLGVAKMTTRRSNNSTSRYVPRFPYRYSPFAIIVAYISVIATS